MKYNRKLAYAVSVALASAAAQAAIAADAPADEEQASAGITEVVVTAQRRSESIQDVPITVQAVTGEQLKALGVQSFNELMKYTPNVTFSGNGPGTGNIFLRGLGGSGSGNQSQSTTAPFPNVGVYLDDQSMQFPARNNDVYLIDMERVEVLEGPQGTLFGGGSQAGAIRYITNKPKYDAVSGETNFAYGITAGGQPNTVINGTINVPITDNIAVRATAFSDHRGGYIDNVPGTIGYYPGTAPHDLGGNPTANNGPFQGNDTNPVTYQGARLSAAWKVNDDWDVLLQQNYQDMKADGYFYVYPLGTDGAPLGKYQINAFYPGGTKDRYESTAWTVNGKIADLLSVVYTGSYMVRHIDGQQDYSNYMRSSVGSAYACIGDGAGYFKYSPPTATSAAVFPQLQGHGIQCSTSVGGWRDQVDNQHQSHELRISTNTDWRIRGLAGLYWEKFNIDDDMNFNYLGIPQCSEAVLAANAAGGPDCLSAVGPVPGAFASHPGLRTDANTAFGEDVQRGYKQRAVFASIDFDVIPKVLTITGGARFYKYDEYEHGSEYYSESTSSNKTITGAVVDHLNGACTAAGLCGFPISLDKSESGHRFRGNATWHVTRDIMAYYTYSEGFRPGGFNRTASTPGNPPSLAGVAPYTAGGKDFQFNKPVGFDSDQLQNHEIGIKSAWLDHRLIVNLSAYTMKWSNIQLPLFDPVHLGNTTFDINGPTYRVRGFEVQFDARITEALSIQGSSSINAPEQINAPCLTSNRATTTNPTPLGQCITVVKGQPYTNPYGVLGTRPPFSPPWMFNVRARYDFPMFGEYRPFGWVGASHIGPQSNEPASFPDGNDPAQVNPTTTLLRYEIPGYTTYDAAVGVVRDNWTASISGQNLSNQYGPTNVSSGQFIKSEIPLRPRVIMANVTWKF